MKIYLFMFSFLVPLFSAFCLADDIQVEGITIENVSHAEKTADESLNKLVTFGFYDEALHFLKKTGVHSSYGHTAVSIQRQKEKYESMRKEFSLPAGVVPEINKIEDDFEGTGSQQLALLYCLRKPKTVPGAPYYGYDIHQFLRLYSESKQGKRILLGEQPAGWCNRRIEVMKVPGSRLIRTVDFGGKANFYTFFHLKSGRLEPVRCGYGNQYGVLELAQGGSRELARNYSFSKDGAEFTEDRSSVNFRWNQKLRFRWDGEKYVLISPQDSFDPNKGGPCQLQIAKGSSPQPNGK